MNFISSTYSTSTASANAFATAVILLCLVACSDNNNSDPEPVADPAATNELVLWVDENTADESGVQEGPPEMKIP